MPEVRDAVRTRRRELKLSIRKAAQRAGFTTHSRWSNIELGINNPKDFETMKAMADALEIAAVEIFPDEIKPLLKAPEVPSDGGNSDHTETP